MKKSLYIIWIFAFIILSSVGCIEKPKSLNGNNNTTTTPRTNNTLGSLASQTGTIGDAVCRINKIHNVLVEDGNQVTAEAIQGKVFVTGWASDNDKNTPESVIIVLDGVEKSFARIGSESQAQVPKYLSDQMSLKDKIGFSKWLPVTPGQHTMQIKVVSQNGESYISPQSINLLIK